MQVQLDSGERVTITAPAIGSVSIAIGTSGLIGEVTVTDGVMVSVTFRHQDGVFRAFDLTK